MGMIHDEKILLKGQDWIWVKPLLSKEPQEIPFAAKILSGDKDKLLVADDEGRESWISKNQVNYIIRCQTTKMRLT